MFAYLTRLTMLIGYASAMVISVVAHDPFHHHAHEVTEQTTASKESVQHHHHVGHQHHGHSHKHGHQHHSHDVANTSTTGGHSHHPDGDDDCRVCEFLSLKCIDAAVAEVESASELITLANQNALCYPEAFAPYKPPSRAPPAC